MDTPDAWLNEWRSLGQAQWQRWAGGPGVAGSPSAPVAGLHDAAAAFTSFAEEFGRLARAAAGAAGPAESARLRGELETLAQNFFARAVPAWPAWAGQGAEWTAALQAWSTALAAVALGGSYHLWASFGHRLRSRERGHP
jgi:hypothetical protein